MSLFSFLRTLRSPEVRLAWLVALAADVLQIAALPVFVEGALSPADAMLDLAVAAILVRLLGWHWAFLPSLLGELIPGLDLFPTWTAAVWYVTRDFQPLEHPPFKSEPSSNPDFIPEPEILPPGPAPARRA